MSNENRMVVLNNLKQMVRTQEKVMERTCGGMCDTCVSVARQAISLLEKPVPDQFGQAYNIGYEDGYIAAVLEMGRRLKGMKWYGGNNQKERAAGMSADHEETAGGGQQAGKRP